MRVCENLERVWNARNRDATGLGEVGFDGTVEGGTCRRRRDWTLARWTICRESRT